jgi:hypothetical protein
VDSGGGDVTKIIMIMAMVMRRALGVRLQFLTEVLIVLICELSAQGTFN